MSDDLDTTGGRAPARPSVVDRVLGAPLGLHAAALAAVLVAVALVVGTGSSFSGDEGAAIIQAQHLADGGGWVLPYELQRVDPTSERLFVTLSELGPDGYAPYAKHPTYPVLLAGADRAAGVPGMVGLSILGAVAAAVAAGALARRVDPAAAVPALWIAGLATPLLFDSQAVLAHTLGAAAAGAATVAVVRLRDRWSALLAIGAVVATALVAGLRTEGTLFAIALGIAGLVAGILDRRPRLAVLGAVLAAIGPAVLLADRAALSRLVVGRIAIAAPTAGEDDLVGGRLRALTRTFVAPGSSWSPSAQLAVLALAGAAVLGALAVRRGFSRPLWTGALVLAGLGSLGVLLAPDPDLVEGLFTAAPVLLVGLLLLDRELLRDRGVSVMAGTAALFTVAVLLLQYERGGAAEWGARFLAVELPILAALAALGILRAGRRVPADARPVGVAALVVVGLVSATASVRALDHYKSNAAEWVDQTAAAVAVVEPVALDTGESKAVVVTTWLSLGRMLWPLDERPAGLFVEPDDLAPTLDALRAAGVAEVVLALPGGTDELDEVADRVEVIEGFPGEDGPIWAVRLVDPRPS